VIWRYINKLELNTKNTNLVWKRPEAADRIPSKQQIKLAEFYCQSLTVPGKFQAAVMNGVKGIVVHNQE